MEARLRMELEFHARAEEDMDMDMDMGDDEFMDDDEVFGEEGMEGDMPPNDPVHDVRLGGDGEGSGGDRPSGSGGGSSRRVHLSFTFKGHVLSNTTSILQAVHQHYINQAASDIDMHGHNLWEETYTFTYRRARSNGSADGDGWAGDVSTAMPNHISALSHLAPFERLLDGGTPLSGAKAGEPIGDALWLLRALELLLKHRSQLGSESAGGKAALGGSLSWDDFVCGKLSSKLTQQLSDNIAMCSGCLPPWCGDLVAACPFLFPFEIRRRLLYCTAMGMHRAIHWLQVNQGVGSELSHHRDGREPRLGRLQRQKVRVSRQRILESAGKVMNLQSARKMVLEVEFFNEVGTGTGPTMEFYTLASRELRLRCHGMWRSEAAPIDASGDEAELVSAPNGLFPAPLAPGSDGSVVDKFKLLGRLAGKALQDGRLLDLELSPAFYRCALRGLPLGLVDLAGIDPDLGKALAGMRKVCRAKRELEAQKRPRGEIAALTLDGMPVAELCLHFVLPGASDFELVPGGAEREVDVFNLDDYVEAVLSATVGDGVARQVGAFREGFADIIPLQPV